MASEVTRTAMALTVCAAALAGCSEQKAAARKLEVSGQPHLAFDRYRGAVEAHHNDGGAIEGMRRTAGPAVEYWRGLALTATEDGDWTRAAKCHLKVLQIRPDDPRSLLALRKLERQHADEADAAHAALDAGTLSHELLAFAKSAEPVSTPEAPSTPADANEALPDEPADANAPPSPTAPDANEPLTVEPVEATRPARDESSDANEPAPVKPAPDQPDKPDKPKPDKPKPDKTPAKPKPKPTPQPRPTKPAPRRPAEAPRKPATALVQPMEVTRVARSGQTHRAAGAPAPKPSQPGPKRVRPLGQARPDPSVRWDPGAGKGDFLKRARISHDDDQYPEIAVFEGGLSVKINDTDGKPLDADVSVYLGGKRIGKFRDLPPDSAIEVVDSAGRRREIVLIHIHDPDETITVGLRDSPLYGKPKP